MLKRVFSAVMFILLLISMLTLAFNIQPVKATGTIYIRADGSIDPPTAPISTLDNITYTLTDNITSDADGIVIQRDNVTLECAGYTIQGSGSGIGIDLSARTNVTVKNAKIDTFSYGIYIAGWYAPGASNNSICGNNITNSQYGIDLFRASNTVLRNNNMVNNTYNLWVFARTLQNYVNDIDASNTVDGRPVYYWVDKQDMSVPLDAGYVGLVNCTNITVQDLTLTKNSQGILSYLTSNTTINGNNIANNRDGIYLYSSNNNNFSGNNITANDGNGIYIDSSSNESIDGNDVINNGYGMNLACSNSTISGNNLTSNAEGIVLQASSNILRSNNMTNNLYNLDVTGGFFNDIDISNTVDAKPVYYWINKQDMTVPSDAGYVGLVNCTRITVQDLNLTKNGQGLLMAFTSNTTITRNNITDNIGGIIGYNSAPTQGSLGNNVFENTIANNTGNGVAFGRLGSYNNIFSENSIINNGGVGVGGGHSATILGNNIKNNSYGIEGGPASVISDNNVTENSEIGITLGYYDVTTYGITISGNNITSNGNRYWSWFVFPIAAGIDLNGASYNIISGNNIENNLGKGIWLHDQSRNNVISENTITNNTYRHSSDPRSGGVSVGFGNDPCPNNVISGNNITNHTLYGPQYAITLAASSNNSIAGNNIANNYGGVSVGDTNSRISGNNITNNDEGIHLWGTTNNTVCENNVASNQIGIMTTSSDNKIYHNAFVNNPSQAVASGSTDVWDDGYPSGGNFWSDYTGVDKMCGPNQDQPGGDGIGDTPYVIDADNQDRYPLMKKYPWEPHDIGVTSVTTSKTGCLPMATVGQGCPLSINITVFNYGNATETFNVTVYVNTTSIASQNVTLLNGHSADIAFTWNTTGFAYGNYTISANVTSVPDETETEDNSMTDDTVYVGIPGDVNGDGMVDILDAIMVSNSFMIKRGELGYNPNADINDDGVVDILDGIILANHFLEHYP